jgi:2-octaprenyl-6-methoxyphenol hydroxylase
VTSSQPHDGAARQIFLPSGPMAALPLSGGRINLVWTERAAVAEALMALDDAGFEAELGKRADGFLPGVKLAGKRHSFPVGLHVADRFHGPRVALAGDSAHQIHPLAGQGLNLGLKDVAALVDVIAEASRVGLDIGAETALAPYTRWRRADVVASAAAMEGFARLFAGPAPIRIAAALAMQAAGNLGPARKLFAQEAGGVLGELPSLMRAG